MTSKSMFAAWDVVVVPFPFTDRATEKRRPALVLSGAAAFNTQAGHSVLAMITSVKDDRQRWPLDTPIADLATAGLPAPSLTRMKLFTLDHRLILRKAGRLGTRDQTALKRALKKLLG